MKRLRHVAWCALAAIALAHGTLSAQETPAAPAAPAPAASEPATAPPPAPAPAAPAAKAAEPAAAPAAAPASSKPTPTLDQRVAMIEAYFGNTDPSLVVKTEKAAKEGAPTEMPKGMEPPLLTTNTGPGHNAWMMASSALVLFMTLPGLALFYGGL